LDACDKDLVTQWIREKQLPNLEKLLDVSTVGETENPRGLEAGGAITSFYFGSLPGQHGHYDANRRFDPETYDYGSYTEEDFQQQPFWNVLADAGKNSVVVDPPYIPLPRHPNVTAVMNYGQHAPVPGTKRIELATNPPSLAQEIAEKFGTDPLGGFMCDHYRPRTMEQMQWFRDTLIERVRGRTAICKYLMDKEPWDFFLAVYGECHCIGHHAWHLHDPSHVDHDAAMAKELGDPMLDVYKAIDEAVGELWRKADGRANLVVYLTHGMEKGYSGTRLLDRILVRLDNKGEESSGYNQRKILRNVWDRAWRASPKPMKRALSPLRGYARDKIYRRGFQPHPEKRRFFEMVLNDRAGGVRINLKGREKHGVVAPEDYDALCEQISSELREIVNVETGEPLVADIVKPRDVCDGPMIDPAPDLAVIWNRDNPIRRVRSPQIGELSHDHPNIRSGDHSPSGMVYLVGDPSGRKRLNSQSSVIDVTRTMAALVGVEHQQFEGTVIKGRKA
jgi:predicted AlkP superfamily phosphohydrolase/phosphomutase